MTAMFAPPPPPQRAFYLACLLSIALHLLVLFVPRHEPAAGQRPPSRLEARLQPRPASVPEAPASIAAPPPPAAARPAARRPVLSSKRPGATSAPTWSAAEKAEMNDFLDELARAPRPTLAQRSRAMAREEGRRLAAQDEAEEALLELRPNAPPIHPFSLESYLEGMIRRLNRSAGYVRNDKRALGVQTAAIQFRLNPDGTLKSFVVLKAGDQSAEIAFIKAIIERSLPFSPFPPDIDRAARSLGITICIRPGSGDGDFGFSRMQGSRC